MDKNLLDFEIRWGPLDGDDLEMTALCAQAAGYNLALVSRGVPEGVLLDGGILMPLPTKLLLNYGARKIISVNITPTKEEISQEYKKRNRLHCCGLLSQRWKWP